jgi:Heterokaryon incompatibility protein (HET)
MVRSIDGRQEPRFIESGGQTGRYVALTHCWGSSKPNRTESSTYQKHLSGMPFKSLPKTFQDAVTVTRALDVPFLWIDSLCIIQDSIEGWENECQKMPGIYTNSVVTIAGPAAAGCRVGFLHRRPVADQGSVHLRWQVSNSATHYDVTLQSICDRFIGPEPEDDSALGKRAWVLQERLLSPRAVLWNEKNVLGVFYRSTLRGHALPCDGLFQMSRARENVIQCVRKSARMVALLLVSDRERLHSCYTDFQQQQISSAFSFNQCRADEN